MEAYTSYLLSLRIEKIFLKLDTLIGHAMLTFGSDFILIKKKFRGNNFNALTKTLNAFINSEIILAIDKKKERRLSNCYDG